MPVNFSSVDMLDLRYPLHYGLCLKMNLCVGVECGCMFNCQFFCFPMIFYQLYFSGSHTKSKLCVVLIECYHICCTKDNIKKNKKRSGTIRHCLYLLNNERNISQGLLSPTHSFFFSSVKIIAAPVTWIELVLPSCSIGIVCNLWSLRYMLY